MSKSHIELWELLKRILKDFFKFKCREINKIKNIKYKALMEQYVNFKQMKKRSNSDDEIMSEVKTQIDNFNNEILYNIYKQTNTDNRGNLIHTLKAGQQQTQSKFIKSIKKQDGDVVFDEKQKRQVIRELCIEAYKHIEIDSGYANILLDKLPSYSSLSFTELVGNIRNDEVTQAIKQLNVGKSPGPDVLSTEFYQLNIDDVTNVLTEMYNEGVNSGCMGESFYHGVMCLLYKKGDENDIDN